MSSIFSFFFGKGHRCTRGAAAHSPFPGGRPFLGTPFSGATELRSNTPFPGGSPFSCTRSPVQPSCGAIRRFRAGEFRRRCGGNVAPPRRWGKKGVDTYGFYPSFESPRFPQRPRERALRLYSISNSHKGTVSAHVFRAVAALSRQIARVLRKYCRRALTA